MTAWTIVTGDFVTTGGMDRANYALAEYLAATGRPVELVAHRVAPDLAARPNVAVRVVPKPLGAYLLGRWPLAWAGEERGQARLGTGGRVVVNGGNSFVRDVNWVHYVHAAYRPTAAASWRNRAKGRVAYWLSRREERRAVRAARVVVCNSDRTRRDVIDGLGVRPERAVTVYYGCDTAQFRPASEPERAAQRAKLGWAGDRPVVAFVGALGDRRKGFDTVFAAWAEVCRSSDWDAVLVVIGRGAELPLWERRAADAGLGDRVRFLGFRSDVPDLLRAADVLVSPTRYEAYGLGVHEALCCGLPAIVSAGAGVAERYPADLAELLLPDPEGAADLAARLRHWRRNLDAFRGRVAPFAEALRADTWDVMARNFLRVVGEPA